MVNDKRKDDIGASALMKIHLQPPAAPANIMLQEENTKLQSEKKQIKGNVWAAVWIVFLGSGVQGAAWGAGGSLGCRPAVVIGPLSDL